MSGPSPLPADLNAWIASVAGNPVARTDEITGGASRKSYVITHADGRKTFLRVDTGQGPLSGTPFTLAREFGVLDFLQGKGVPIARTFAFSPAHNAGLMECVPGHTTYQKAGTEAEESAIRRNLMAAVVALQKIDATGLAALGPDCGKPLGQTIPADLKLWRTLYSERVKPRDALLEFALNWLTHGIVDADRPSVIVHGDVGPGNFLIQDNTISALIDWEMVRIGHPLEDVACIIARSLGVPFGRPDDHIANYERLSGAAIDRRKLDYALALVITRWLIAMSMALSRPSAQQNVPVLFAFWQLNGLALVDAMGRCFGVAADTTAFRLGSENAAGFLFTYLQDSLSTLAAAKDARPADAYTLRGIATIATYLDSYIAYGPETYAREEHERISQLLGRSFSSNAEADAAICDHASTVALNGAGPLAAFFSWKLRRDRAIMHKSLGALADNRISY